MNDEDKASERISTCRYCGGKKYGDEPCWHCYYPGPADPKRTQPEEDKIGIARFLSAMINALFVLFWGGVAILIALFVLCTGISLATS